MAIGEASYSFTESLLSGNSASTVAKDTVTGGVAGGITGGILAGAGYGIQKGISAIGNAVKGGTTPAKTDPAKSVLDGACFIAGTFVLTSLGLKTIESVRPGDKVLAADPETGRQEEKEVVRTFVKETDTLVHLVIEGEEIVTTETHPFYVEGKGWTPAGELTEEDYVLDSNNERIRVKNKYLERLEESIKVYNFEVEDFHTYYVGQTGVLVHNKCFEEPISILQKNPLQNIEYTPKVKAQMDIGDYHSFPKSVDAFGASGKVSNLTGRDNIIRTKVEISGSYKGKIGVFEYIIEPDGKRVNHRLFKPYN